MNGLGLRRTLRRLSPLIALGLLTLALWLIHHELARFQLRDVESALHHIPPLRVGAALLFTLLGYTVLSGYDVLAMRYVGRELPLPKIAFAAFEGFAFSQNVALGGLTGASLRYRLYSGWGLSAADVTAIVVFNALSFWLGFLVLGGIALVVEPGAVPPMLRVHPVAARLIGLLLLGLALGVFAANALRRRPWRVASFEFRPPRRELALGQMLVATLDWSCAAAVLYVLLPPSTISYPAFLGSFLIAQLAGLVSHVPGGLGVFEAVLVASLAPRAPASTLLASLVVFRVVYYLVPLFSAAILLAGRELLWRERAAKVPGTSVRISSLAPPVLAMLVFVCGAGLLASSVLPRRTAELRELAHLVPLPLVELSHFMGSLVGALLLVLALGIQRRQRDAFVLTVLLMLAAVALSLLRGLDYPAAALLLFAVAVLAPCRAAFYRKASLLDDRFTPGWTLVVASVMAGTAWLAFFVHRHAAYSADLFWQFAFEAHAPRALRAEVGAIATLVVVGAARLLRPPRVPMPATPADLERARAIALGSKNTTAWLALLGDKRFLFSASGEAALMYAPRGRSWVVLGDPIGAEADARELVWAFRELSDRNGSWAVFYEVGAERAETYRELGFGQFMLGEEARVALDRFTLEGPARKSLRSSHRHAERDGSSFEILPREAVPELLPELRHVSNEWLAAKHTAEKGFSLGFFDENYLANFPIAIVRRAGQVLAFANVLQGAEREELSVDLMRHRALATHGVMDYLFVELMLWGKRAGYRWFNLGMAPLAGLSGGSLAPLWDRAGAFLFQHGEHFYNFEGLRSYKAKFDPVWSPRYLACPGGIALPFVLVDIAALVSGGVSGVVARRPRARSETWPARLVMRGKRA